MKSVLYVCTVRQNELASRSGAKQCSSSNYLLWWRWDIGWWVDSDWCSVAGRRSKVECWRRRSVASSAEEQRWRRCRRRHSSSSVHRSWDIVWWCAVFLGVQSHRPLCSRSTSPTLTRYSSLHTHTHTTSSIVYRGSTNVTHATFADISAVREKL